MKTERITGSAGAGIAHIVNVSGGAGSAVALFRVLERFGRDEVAACFADTRSEDADLYRFLDDVERVAGIPITRLIDGRNIWDVFLEDYTLTTAGGGCRASWELKKQPLSRHAASIATPETAIIYVGMSEDEDDRMTRIEKALEPWDVDFPLTWKPSLGWCDVMDDLKRRGIKRPRLYESGYPHNNCGGRCIMAGIKQWAGVLKDDLDGFRESEENEQRFLAILRERGRKEHAILKDRRGGDVKNYSLRQLREDVECGVRPDDESWRASSCYCMWG
jgi:hypothetical protein